MKNRRTAEFKKRFNKLPHNIQKQAKEAYRLFKENPGYPGLHFKRLETKEPFWSVRIGAHYRAVGLRDGDTIYWDFIGTHEEFNNLF